MKLFVGLGNPGEKYKGNRHNVGFIVVDAIADAQKFDAPSNKFESVVYKKGEIILLKPQTYMNLSGKAVLACANFFKVAKQDIIVCHDDIDLALCKIRVKVAGGSGGNNGINSIDEYLGKDYKRLRFGVGRPEHKSEVSSFVLSDFTKDENTLVKKTIDIICDNVHMLLDGDDAGFLNKLALDKNK